MNNRPLLASYLVIGSFLVALLFSVIAIPDWAQHLRPQWLALILIYWCLMRPQHIGITTAWVTGLFLDVLTGSLLGAHALSMSLIAFVTLNIYQRTRIFPLWQQSLVVFIMLGIEHLLQFWIIGISTDITPGLEYWLQPVVGLFLWPWLFILMSEAQHRTQGNL
jgi:rod shape-determining protein MreD